MKPKLKYLLGLLAAVCMLFTASSCSSDSSEPDPAPPTVSNPKVKRAVLVYMMADNSLGNSSFDRNNLADMIRAAKDGLLDDSYLYVYHDDKFADHPTLKRVTPRGLEIQVDYPDTPSSAEVGRMEQVIAKFKELAPADRYGLILWSHADGWVFHDTDGSGISTMDFGDDKGKHMSIPDLAAALEGKGFDYIYFDCCHMANIESLYELRNCTDYFVGSTTELPAAGMPYYLTLPYLVAENPDLVAAAKATFDKYDAMTGTDRTCTMSVIDASALEEVADATRQLLATKPVLPENYEGQPFERPKRYGIPCYLFDFQDYMDALYYSNRTNDVARTAYGRLLDAMDDAVLYKAATPTVFGSIYLDAHCGLSSFILRTPEDAMTKGYNRLQWYHDVASVQF